MDKHTGSAPKRDGAAVSLKRLHSALPELFDSFDHAACAMEHVSELRDVERVLSRRAAPEEYVPSAEDDSMRCVPTLLDADPDADRGHHGGWDSANVNAQPWPDCRRERCRPGGESGHQHHRSQCP